MQSQTNVNIVKNATKIGIYHLLAFSFCFIFIISNIAAAKMGYLAGIYLDTGTLYFPLLYIINDMTTEIYGFRASRKIIWLAVFSNILFVFLITIAVKMPSPEQFETNKAFDILFTTSPRILVASVSSFLFGEYVNSVILAVSKVRLSGRMFMQRAIFSTLIGVSVESGLFAVIAFYGIVGAKELFSMIITLILVKVGYEILCIPITNKIVKYIKLKENIDYYDNDTKFTMFQL